ncbi:TRAP transporter small permease [Denitromonas ohlonensis]|uniref:TRAP transporter small permease protein n=2 Tax=Denitromonas TaxID=139331 RepID=A0A557SQR9_9RHOO|nr:TRAP transporter small permease [Denitromonas ohlonensis]TVO66896.1 TRAP transporter small permease [Denitromonas ohlonensis]TVO79766.1 TRAP transporter small permease [Denitromonas ohlonensis]
MHDKDMEMDSTKSLFPARPGVLTPGVATAATAQLRSGALRRALIRLDDLVGTLEDWFLSAAHAVIACIVFLGVIVRYVWNDPLTWDQELIVILFTWLMFIGGAAAIRHRMHIRIDLVGGLFMRPGFRFMAWIGVILGFSAVGTLLWSASINFTDVLGAQTPMLQLSQGTLDGALPVGLVLLLLHMTRILVESGPAAVFAGELEHLE